MKDQIHIKVLYEIFKRHFFSIKSIRYRLYTLLPLLLIVAVLEYNIIIYATQLIFKKFDSHYDKLVAACVFLIISNSVTLINEMTEYYMVRPSMRAWIHTLEESFATYLKADHYQLNKLGLGEMQTTINRRGQAVYDVFESFAIEIVPAIFRISYSIYNMGLSVGIFVPAVMLMSTTLFVLATVYIIEKRIQYKIIQVKRQNKLCDTFLDSFYNYENVLAFAGHHKEVRRVDDKLEKYEAAAVNTERIIYLWNFVQKMIFCIEMLVIIFLGIYGIMILQVSALVMTQYLMTARHIADATWKLGGIYTQFKTGIAAYTTFRHADEYIPGNFKIKQIARSIKFHSVTVIHKNMTVLHSVNLEILKGERVAFVGDNGSGKSSLAKTLLGFNQYTGNITLDDTDLRNVNIFELRKLISYINQECQVFADTIRYNIKYGTSMTDDEMIKLCKFIGVHNTIMKQKHGYSTKIRSKGVELSGGEKQKMILARSLYKNAHLYIFDEPTANLDVNAETRVMERIMDKKRRLTIIMILHNARLLHMFDKVVFLKNNTIFDVGTHNELIARTKEYNDFCKKHIN